MGKSAPTPPPAPDPTQIAAAQTQSNIDTAAYTAALNHVNFNGPQGSVYYDQTPGEPQQWNEDVTLSPSQQGIYDSLTSGEQGALDLANTQLGRVGDVLANPVQSPGGGLISTPAYGSQIGAFDPGAPVQTSVGPQDFGAALRSEVGNQFGSEMQLLAPQLAQQSEQEDARLTAQGLNPDDAAWRNAQTLMGNQQATELGQAAANAVNLGNAEQQALFGEQLGAGQFANAAQQQQYGENQGAAAFANQAVDQDFQNKLAYSQFYNQANQQAFQENAYAQELPINELDALLSSGQVSMPAGAQYTPTQVQPTNVLGAYALNSNVAEQNYAQQLQNYSGGLGGLFNLGAAALKLLPSA